MNPIVMDPRTALMLDNLAKVPKEKLVLPCRREAERLCTACTTVAWVRVKNIVTEALNFSSGTVDKLRKTIEFLQSPKETDNLEITHAEFALLAPFQDDVLGPGAIEMIEILERLTNDLNEYNTKWGPIMESRSKIIEDARHGGGNVPS